MKKLLCASLILLCSLYADDAAQVVVDNTHVNYFKGVANLAAYGTIKNTSDHAITLISASCKICKKTELHEHVIHEGVAKMRAIGSLKIPAKGEVVLKRGSDHIMLMGLIDSECKAALAADKVTITLHFSDDTKRDVDFKIVQPHQR